MSAPLEMTLDWAGLDVIQARRIAARKLHLRISHSTPNSLFCRRLELPADRLRPQRLIHWAKQQSDWGRI
jgi:hypothetical protein